MNATTRSSTTTTQGYNADCGGADDEGAQLRRHSRKPNSRPVKGVKPLVRVIVAARDASYKAPIDFVFFGRYKNDNNTERSRDRHSTGRDLTSFGAAVESTGLIAMLGRHDGTCCQDNRGPNARLRGRPGRTDVDDWLMDRRPSSYWAATRRPFPSLLLVAPLVIGLRSGRPLAGGSGPLAA